MVFLESYLNMILSVLNKKAGFRPPGLFQNHIVIISGNLANRRVAFVPGVPCHTEFHLVVPADMEVFTVRVAVEFFFTSLHGPMFEHACTSIDVLKSRALPAQSATKQVDVFLSAFLNNNHDAYLFLS